MDTTTNICGIEPSLADVGNIGLKVARLLEDIRRAVQRSPEAARPAALNLVTLLTPGAPAEPAARGGLAPWQKRKIERYVTAHLDRPLQVDELAKLVPLSVSYFSRAFKETFGECPHAYLIRLRLKLAQDLMMSTNDPLSQVAVACGFADQSHFTRLFRRALGETPNAWRRRNLTETQAEAKKRCPIRSLGSGLHS